MNNTNTKLTTEQNTYDVLFALLRSTLWGEDRYPLDAFRDALVDWNEVYKELVSHAIQILPIDLLCRVDSARSPRYLTIAGCSVSTWYATMEEQQILCELLQASGIPFVILKGAASAYYYPQPTYRQMGDIDFLVPPKFFEQARLLMLEKDYKLLDVETFRHLEFTKNGVLFELHRVFAAFKEPERAKLLDDMLFEAFDRLETATMEDNRYKIPLFPPLERGLILIEHINQHLEDGLGLRQILDWTLYVDKELDNETWARDFAPIVQQLGLESLATAVTRMCQIYLGLREDITWCATTDENLCHQLMDYIMSQGNFGCKGDVESHKSVKALSVMQNMPAFFKRLQQLGLQRWPAVHKHPKLKPVLTPFAWIWQLCRYIHLGLKREHPFKSLVQDIKKTRTKDALMEKLGVNQRKHGIATPDGLIH